MLLVISPSKTQDFSPAKFTSNTQPAFLEHSAQLVEELRKLSVAQIGKLMKTSNKLSQSTWQSLQDFHLPLGVKNAKQALLAFKGDVYSGIKVNEYSDEDLQFAQRHLRILSGLYGVLRPLDLISPYRLEMGTALPTIRGKNLYDFWGMLVSDYVNKQLEKFEKPVLVNLASQEYFKVIRSANIKGSLVDISFKEKKDGKYKTVAIHAKRARGKMVDFVIANRLTEVEKLGAFNEDGYQLNRELSSLKEMVFCRDS